MSRLAPRIVLMLLVGSAASCVFRPVFHPPSNGPDSGTIGSDASLYDTGRVGDAAADAGSGEDSGPPPCTGVVDPFDGACQTPSLDAAADVSATDVSDVPVDAPVVDTVDDASPDVSPDAADDASTDAASDAIDDAIAVDTDTDASADTGVVEASTDAVVVE